MKYSVNDKVRLNIKQFEPEIPIRSVGIILSTNEELKTYLIKFRDKEEPVEVSEEEVI